MFRANTDKLPGSAYETFGLRQRPAPRSRRATCAEVDCPNYLHGWRTVISPVAPQAAAQLVYLRGDRTRRHTEHRDGAGRIVFTFDAGQTCFGEHWIEMTQLYVVRRGDHRPDGRGELRRHTRAEHWVEEFGENQQKLAEAQQRG